VPAHIDTNAMVSPTGAFEKGACSIGPGSLRRGQVVKECPDGFIVFCKGVYVRRGLVAQNFPPDFSRGGRLLSSSCLARVSLA